MNTIEEMYLNVMGEDVKIDAITSDTHWGHVNITKLADRDFDNSESTKDMDQFLVDQWNSVVNKNDTVLHLGDVAMGLVKETLLNVKKCNGEKILVPGNHDYISSFSSANRRAKHQDVYDECFATILPENGNILTVVLNEYKVGVQLSHYPSEELYLSEGRDDGRKDKYAAFRPDLNIAPVIHGHTHSHRLISEEGRQLHVGVDAAPLYKPLTADLICRWAFSLPKSFFSADYSVRHVDVPWGPIPS